MSSFPLPSLFIGLLLLVSVSTFHAFTQFAFTSVFDCEQYDLKQVCKILSDPGNLAIYAFTFGVHLFISFTCIIIESFFNRNITLSNVFITCLTPGLVLFPCFLIREILAIEGLEHEFYFGKFILEDLVRIIGFLLVQIGILTVGGFLGYLVVMIVPYLNFNYTDRFF